MTDPNPTEQAIETMTDIKPKRLVNPYITYRDLTAIDLIDGYAFWLADPNDNQPFLGYYRNELIRRLTITPASQVSVSRETTEKLIDKAVDSVWDVDRFGCVLTSRDAVCYAVIAALVTPEQPDGSGQS